MLTSMLKDIHEGFFVVNVSRKNLNGYGDLRLCDRGDMHSVTDVKSFWGSTQTSKLAIFCQFETRIIFVLGLPHTPRADMG